MATKPLKIGISARIDHPQPGQAGLRSKTLQYLELPEKMPAHLQNISL